MLISPTVLREGESPAGGLSRAGWRSDGSDRKAVILEGGDFVHIPSAAIHVIANASETEEASLIFCYIGVGNTTDAQSVWLDQMPRGNTLACRQGEREPRPVAQGAFTPDPPAQLLDQVFSDGQPEPGGRLPAGGPGGELDAAAEQLGLILSD